MITLTSNAATEIAKQYGIKPVVVVEINWDNIGALTKYSHIALFGSEAKLVSLSEIDYTNDDFLGIVESASAVLSDSDGGPLS